ncbi:MAG: phytanoyl-CoA dioxygenase family protein [Flavobacteriales bacterium]|nr:phytanoyl-CoA dioxygenase family protein [Flavobacteriales bacterium]
MIAQSTIDPTVFKDAVESMTNEGFVILENFLPEEMRKQMLEISSETLSSLLKILEGKEIGIGAKNGFIEICQRSEGRWDAQITPEELGFQLSELPWAPVIAQLLGDDAQMDGSGIISSAPNTPAQEWHIDSEHKSAEHLPVHAINVLLALEDIPVEMGPTGFSPKTHFLSNHLSKTKLKSEEMVYQHSGTTLESLVEGTESPVPEAVTRAIPAGSVIMFDDRLFHRGNANKSEKDRHVVYFGYSKKGHNNIYFDTEESIYEAA